MDSQVPICVTPDKFACTLPCPAPRNRTTSFLFSSGEIKVLDSQPMAATVLHYTANCINYATLSYFSLHRICIVLLLILCADV